jgi:hypothetical protein
MVLVVSARMRVNLSRAFEKRPRWEVHSDSDYDLEGVVTPQQVLLCTDPSGQYTRAIMCVPGNCGGGFVDDYFCRAILIVDDSPFSGSPSCGARSSLLRVSGPRPCLFQQGGCAFLLDCLLQVLALRCNF